MFESIKKLFSKAEPEDLAAIPDGQRVYAIGDIHGCDALFAALIEAVEADDRAAGGADTLVILLGDLVDRGPDSAGVIARAKAWQARRKVRILSGNHEEMFLRSFADIEMLRHFLRHGGRETVMSFGVEAKEYTTASLEEVQKMLVERVPKDVREYVAGFETLIAVGDYVFVHAGINPEIPLAEQKAHDLRWIREPFLSWEAAHEKLVVHGHTINEEPQDKGNRIGIDTGAYNTGRLTCLVLEGYSRRYIEASYDENHEIRTGPRI